MLTAQFHNFRFFTLIFSKNSVNVKNGLSIALTERLDTAKIVKGFLVIAVKFLETDNEACIDWLMRIGMIWQLVGKHTGLSLGSVVSRSRCTSGLHCVINTGHKTACVYYKYLYNTACL